MDHGIGLRKTKMAWLDTYDAEGNRVGLLNVAMVIHVYTHQVGVKQWVVYAESTNGKVVIISQAPMDNPAVALEYMDDRLSRW